MEPVIVAVLIGIVVYIIIVALIPKRILAESSQYTKAMLKRLEQENASAPTGQEDTVEIMREHIQKANLLTRVFFTLPGAKVVYPKLMKAGLADNVDTLLLVSIAMIFLLVWLLRGFGLLGVFGALLGVYLLLGFYIRRRIRKRNSVFLNDFPDALDMIVRSVRSGYPLNAAVRMVSENMQPPISTEFKQVADETAFGSSLVDSLKRLSVRIDEPDIRFFVVVLSVQQEVGGNLAEVLSNLSTIIRKRKHLRLKVKALTSEGRATAWVLGLLPVVLFLVIHYVAPHHLEPFFTTGLGNLLLGTAIGIVLLGGFIVNKMASIEV